MWRPVSTNTRVDFRLVFVAPPCRGRHRHCLLEGQPNPQFPCEWWTNRLGFGMEAGFHAACGLTHPLNWRRQLWPRTTDYDRAGETVRRRNQGGCTRPKGQSAESPANMAKAASTSRLRTGSRISLNKPKVEARAGDDTFIASIAWASASASSSGASASCQCSGRPDRWSIDAGPYPGASGEAACRGESGRR